MPIVVNGTTIPENVANVLNVNGTNITSVVCNGITVWTQSLIVREPASDGYYIASPVYRWSERNASSIVDAVWNGVNMNAISGSTSVSNSGWTYYRGNYVETTGSGLSAIYKYKIYRIQN